MANIASSKNKLNTDETKYRAAVSEALMNKVGGSVNYLIDTTDTHTSDIATNVSDISSNASAISNLQGDIETYTPTTSSVTNFSSPTGQYVKVSTNKYLVTAYCVGEGLSTTGTISLPTTLGTINTVMGIGTPSTSDNGMDVTYTTSLIQFTSGTQGVDPNISGRVGFCCLIQIT